MNNPLLATIRSHKLRIAAGVTSVCSAHPLVLRAAVEQAAADGGWVLVEATSNQVDQFGRYTGMSPADFRDLVHAVADQHGLPGSGSSSAVTTSVRTLGARFLRKWPNSRAAA